MEPTGTFILVRHGESQSNRDRHFAASGEVPITELGRRQAREAAGQIAVNFRPRRVISSTFRRARQSAEILAAALQLPVEVVEDLHERDLGCLKGRPWEHRHEVARNDPAYDPEREWLWRPCGGESYEDVRLRVLPVLEQLRLRYPQGESVVVSHGAVMRSIHAHFSGAWDRSFIPQNCAMLLLPFDLNTFHPPRVLCSTPAEGA
ncbi:MAG TPA: histidine phosphatase family protein [Candidatus Limnocylindrales bacterium]|nr:histidine phosphatase family protein [Candidatus Limnocylindrales bacterium]